MVVLGASALAAAVRTATIMAKVAEGNDPAENMTVRGQIAVSRSALGERPNVDP